MNKFELWIKRNRELVGKIIMVLSPILFISSLLSPDLNWEFGLLFGVMFLSIFFLGYYLVNKKFQERALDILVCSSILLIILFIIIAIKYWVIPLI